MIDPKVLVRPEVELVFGDLDAVVGLSEVGSAVLYGDFAEAEQRIRWYVSGRVAHFRRLHTATVLGWRRRG